MAFLQKYASYKLFVILNSTIPKTWNLIAKKMKENILNFSSFQGCHFTWENLEFDS